MSMRTALMEMANNQMDEVKSVDYGKRMTDAQKKKFHDLKKKMTGGPEHQKIMRKNQSPVKSDDEFHNLVLKKVMSEERAAWVPESIADEQVEAFMEATLAAVTEGADTFVFEGKHYKAKSKSEAKKLDPVGKADADIDNDGDVDSSDDYLKNRRKAIKKSMKDDDDDEVNEIDGAASGMRAADKEPTVNLKSLKKRRAAEKARKTARPNPLRGKKDMKFESTESVDEALDDKDTDTVKAVVKALKGASKAHAGQAKQLKKDLQDAAHTEMDPKDHVKYNDEMEMYCVYNKSGKVVAKFKDEEDANNYAMKNHDDLMEVSYKTAMKSYQKAMGQSKDADTAGDKKTGDKKFNQAVKFGRYANKKFQSSKNKKKLVRTFTGKESVEEAAAPGSTAQHGPDTATSDTFQKQIGGGRSPREKEFIDMHNTEVGMDIEKVTTQNKKGIEDALKVSPGRMGDNLKSGDTSFVNPVKADIIDGITKALQQMKTNS